VKYKEPKILLEVRKIKERLHDKMEVEGVDAFFDRINRRAGKAAARVKPKLSKKGR
jgi:Lhr-like helicase